jgi:hypothetical protein
MYVLFVIAPKSSPTAPFALRVSVNWRRTILLAARVSRQAAGHEVSMLSFDGHSFSGMGGGRSFQEQAPPTCRSIFEGVRNTVFLQSPCIGSRNVPRGRACTLSTAPPAFADLSPVARCGLVDTVSLPPGADGHDDLSHNVRSSGASVRMISCGSPVRARRFPARLSFTRVWRPSASGASGTWLGAAAPDSGRTSGRSACGCLQAGAALWRESESGF